MGMRREDLRGGFLWSELGCAHHASGHRGGGAALSTKSSGTGAPTTHGGSSVSVTVAMGTPCVCIHTPRGI